MPSPAHVLKQLEALLTAWGVDWLEFKQFIGHASNFSNDALHLFLGFFIQLVVAAVLRSSLARFWPWAAVLGIELVNEWGDLHVEKWPSPGTQWGESAKDLILTMALPTVMLVLARWKPALLGAGRR